MGQNRAVVGLVVLATLLGVALGCRQEVPPLFRRNRPPETTLTIIAEDSTEAFYRYHVYWRGEDPDGEVVRYLFAITDTLSRDEEENWDPQLADDRDRGVFSPKTDSVFVFDSAVGRQAFNIVAIDDFGAMDPSPARAFFRIVDNGLPRIQFLDVRIESDDPNTLPCTAEDPCTVPTFTDFSVRFSASTGNGIITGYTWQVDPPNWEPFGSDCDTCFIQLATIDGDTTVLDSNGELVWSISEGQDTVSVFLRSSREDPLDPGRFTFRARVRDDARLMSLLREAERIVNVNYDPDTRLFSVPECDCPLAPPGCDSQERVPVGWITGIGQVDSFPMDEWRLFCAGDTIPNFSRVTFFAEGWDDPRDSPVDPEAPELPEVDFRFRFEWKGSRNQPFSAPALPVMDVPLPSAVGGGTFRGARIGWQTCPLDYKFEAGAVDEHGKIDGTPDSLPFYVGGSPVIDSVRVPAVIVFVPSCTPERQSFCATVSQDDFGPDTLLVFGTAVPDDISDGFQTTLGLGWNDFAFPLKAWGHDHPRDRNPETGPEFHNDAAVGQIRSWLYDFDCTLPFCQDVVLPGEGNWQAEIRQDGDPENQEIFDEDLIVQIPLDTLCTVGVEQCPILSLRAKLLSSRFGPYEFTLQGRDTDPIKTCRQPSDLGTNASEFDVSIASLGRTTQQIRRNTVWVQLWDVRPPSKAAAVTPAGNQPFTNRKRLLR